MYTSYVLRFVRAPEPAGAADETRFGGLPTSLGALQWPTCKGCSQPMRFCGQFAAHPDVLPLKKWHLLSWFMCDNPQSAGRCATDEPGSGCNALIPQVRGAGDVSVLAAPDRPTARPLNAWAVERAIVVSEPEASDDPDEWTEAQQDAIPEGPKLGGQPWWIETAERPDCPHCKLPMRFLGQVPEDLDVDPSLFNFGEDGEGYFFICPKECGAVGTAFLWQSV